MSLSRIEGAQRAEIITGEADLLLTIRCRDMDDYRRVLLGKIQAIEGITETRTIMVISE
jgi:DNA-binding Lrp family transcriptional regulator